MKVGISSIVFFNSASVSGCCTGTLSDHLHKRSLAASVFPLQ